LHSKIGKHGFPTAEDIQLRWLNRLGVAGIGDIGNLRYAELLQRLVDLERPALADPGTILDSNIVHGGLGSGSRLDACP
jgi:hypothetical protein